MECDYDKIDEMTVALLYLVASEKPDGKGARALKGFDLTSLDRLYKKGWIEKPSVKTMTLELTETGYKKSKELFDKHFCKDKSRQ